MTNKEKAQRLAEAVFLHYPVPIFIREALEAELNRLDAPEPKKWEPRGGEWYLSQNDTVCRGVSPTSVRMAGRTYRTKAEAKRAAPLHRKLGRLVNWLVEHSQEREIRISPKVERSYGDVVIIFEFSRPDNEATEKLLEGLKSGEIEL